MRLTLLAGTLISGLALAAAACAPAPAAPAAPAAPVAATMPAVTVYHLEGRRSERIVWLMEELGLPYTLEFKRGDLAGSMARSAPSTPACRSPRR